MKLVSMVKDDNSFKSFIINSFDMIADLNEERYVTLNNYMNRINAGAYDVQTFKEAFGLFDAGFISIFNFVFDESHVEELVEFGNKFKVNSSVKAAAK